MKIEQAKLIFGLALLAMACAMALAWNQLVMKQQQDWPATAAARAGDLWLSRQALQRAINGVNTSRREPLDAEQQRQVLQRLLDERLLLQYGLDLGLAVTAPEVRKALVQGVLASIRANQTATQPSDEQLAAWYEANAARFSSGGQWRLRVFKLRGDAAALKAEQLLSSLKRGEQPTILPEPYIPERLLPLNKLRDYLGNTLAEEVAGIDQPTLLGPIPQVDGMAIIQVLNAKPPQEKRLSEVREEVVEAWRREQGEQALRDLLVELRQRYPVTVAEEFR